MRLEHKLAVLAGKFLGPARSVVGDIAVGIAEMTASYDRVDVSDTDVAKAFVEQVDSISDGLGLKDTSAVWKVIDNMAFKSLSAFFRKPREAYGFGVSAKIVKVETETDEYEVLRITRNGSFGDISLKGLAQIAAERNLYQSGLGLYKGIIARVR